MNVLLQQQLGGNSVLANALLQAQTQQQEAQSQQQDFLQGVLGGQLQLMLSQAHGHRPVQQQLPQQHQLLNFAAAALIGQQQQQQQQQQQPPQPQQQQQHVNVHHHHQHQHQQAARSLLSGLATQHLQASIQHLQQQHMLPHEAHERQSVSQSAPRQELHSVAHSAPEALQQNTFRLQSPTAPQHNFRLQMPAAPLSGAPCKREEEEEGEEEVAEEEMEDASDKSPAHEKEVDEPESKKDAVDKTDSPHGTTSKPPKKGADRDPNMPKRPSSAFFIYSSEVRDKVRQDNPGISFGNLSKHIGNLWKEMDPEEKQRFLNLEREDKDRYQEEMKEYRRQAGLPEKPTKRRRSGGSSAVHAHLRSIDDLVEEIDEVDAGADSDAPPGKRRISSGQDMSIAGGVRKASLNSSSRKTSARPKRRGTFDPVDWVQCESCGCWRFFDPGLDPAAVNDKWTCSQAGRECGKFVEEEDFMRDWTQLMGTDAQQSLYTFVLEGQTFAVYDLYWAVMALGGYNAISKWKDVGNEMMWRKLQCLVSKAPGKNYGLIKNQWDRWNLFKYHESFCAKPVPKAYSKPAFDVNNQSLQGVSGASSAHSAALAEKASSPLLSRALTAKKEAPAWRGRAMWPRKEEAKPTPSKSPVQRSLPSPVQLVSHSSSATMASLQQALPPVPTHPPLPELPELTYEEKLELRLQRSLSYVRGLRKEEVPASRDHSRAWRARCEAVRFRSEPLGVDRYHRRYWILSDDFSRIWVEKSDHARREHVDWSCYSTLQEVQELLAALNPHGMPRHACKHPHAGRQARTHTRTDARKRKRIHVRWRAVLQAHVHARTCAQADAACCRRYPRECAARIDRGLPQGHLRSNGKERSP